MMAYQQPSMCKSRADGRYQMVFERYLECWRICCVFDEEGHCFGYFGGPGYQIW